jgi:hypothetical protein
MIYPLTERFDALRKELLADVERQQKALIEHDKVQESVKEAATLIDRSNGEFAGKIQAAIGAIDVTTLAREIIYTLKNETLYQIEGALRTLGSHTANTVEASEAAKRTIQAWRKLNLIGIALGAALAAVLLAGIAGVWGWWTMENHYRERLAAQIIRLDATDDAYRQALSLGFSMHLEPWVDEQGKPVESGYSIVIDGIDDALPRELDGQKSEVVRMKAVPLVRHVEAVIRQYEKLKK